MLQESVYLHLLGVTIMRAHQERLTQLQVSPLGLLLLVACAAQASPVVGRYIDPTAENTYLELMADGTLFLQVPSLAGGGLSGKYVLVGNQLTLDFSNGTASRLTMSGDTLTFPDGAIAVRELKPLGAPTGNASEAPQSAPGSDKRTDALKLRDMKHDLLNVMTSQEAYFSDYKTYGSLAQLQAAMNFSLSLGNTAAVTGVTNGFTATVRNESITRGFTRCTVQVGAGAISGVDGVISCSQ
jgi:hypothetical protein